MCSCLFMEPCIFCKIGAKEIPSHTVYEDSTVFAFLDIKPHTTGHTVVIPKKHGVRVFDFEDKLIGELFVSVRKVMEKLDKKLNPDGFNVGWNHNTAAGQVVPHFHVHIMPRYMNDGGGSMHSIIKNPGKMSVEDVAKLVR